MKTKGPQANPGCLPGAATFTIKEECSETGGPGERKRTSKTREKPRFRAQSWFSRAPSLQP